MPFDAQRDLIAALLAPTPPRTKGAAGTPARESAFVSVDPHLPVTEATLSEWRKALSDVDAFFAGEDELLLDDAHSDPRQALPRLVSGRLRFVVFKRSAQGGIVFDARDEHFYTWDARTAAFVDQTGAGDAFSAGFIVAHLARLSLETCLQRAVVTASFAVAGWGCEALLATTRWEAEARWRLWYTSEH
jgi:sugar/nucleoside kinase (ribokinase family)